MYGEKLPKGKLLLGILLCLPFLLWGGVRTYKSIRFDIDCGGHLKRAADANSVELATQEMEVVMSYLEREGHTSGYTSVLWRTPDEDVGFWYQNLKSALDELKRVKPDTTPLERTNILMKLRETLLDSGKDGASITVPPGISVFPNNTPYFIWGWLSFVAFCVGVVFVCIFGFKFMDSKM